MSRLFLAPAARDDLDAIHAYISADNLDAADRVLEAAFETFTSLIHHPALGRERYFENAALTGLRSFGINGYPNYIVFYRIKGDVIEVVRVLHGARNFDELFSGE